jgi:hypothetical protein
MLLALASTVILGSETHDHDSCGKRVYLNEKTRA